MKNNPPTGPSSRVAESVARSFFGVTDDPASLRKAIRRCLLGAAMALLAIPLLFYIRTGEVDALAQGLTVFLVVYNLLAAVGLYYLRRPEYHTPVALRGDRLDYVGAFWLVACVFGPFFGWVITTVPTLTLADWRWLYALRVFLAVVLPVVTALALLRYVRGKGALVMLAMLILVTALPVWSAWGTAQDLLYGPAALPSGDAPGLYLAHTQQFLKP